MSIIGNKACPKCQESNHDKTANHAIVFEDGGVYCNRKDYHSDGEVYYVKGSEDYIADLLKSDVDGTTAYTIETYKELSKAGKFDRPAVRALAMSGMKPRDRWSVSDDLEREVMLQKVKHEESYFNQLPVRNLVTRGIRGDVCRRFDVHVGIGSDGKVAQHYYPVHSRDGGWWGAKCRTLPKTFSYDALGYTWGDVLMFGQMASKADFIKGSRKSKLLIVGGELDAMSAWQMLSDYDPEGKYSYHVWSPVHGESALEDLLVNKEEIDKFSTIICGMDNDPVGRAMNIKISRLFRGKCKFLVYPSGTKDANQCLVEGRESEFRDAWFNPVDRYLANSVKTVDDLFDSALVEQEMGLSWFAKSLNKLTFGIRLNMLHVIGAGSGVGKTAFTKAINFGLMETHGEPVGVIYLEEPPVKTLRSYASFYNPDGKRYDLPKNDPEDPESFTSIRDYTDDEVREHVEKLREQNTLHIVDTGGDKSIEAVMSAVDDMMAMGIKYITIDNLTAITHPKAGSKVDSIDETMKAIGTYKDENPVCIFLVSHLKRVLEGGARQPHNFGGEVYESDFRGAGSITMWANYVWSIERNCFADNELDKRTTRVRCLKDRDTGMFTGDIVKLLGQKVDNRLVQFEMADMAGISSAGVSTFDLSDVEY